MLLMVKKQSRGRICHFINRYAKANDKYMKDFDTNKELSYHKYWDINNLYCRAMSQKLPVDGFEWVEDSSHFNVDFIKGYNEESDERYFDEVDIQYAENLHKTQSDFPFLPESIKKKSCEKLVANLHDNTELSKVFKASFKLVKIIY